MGWSGEEWKEEEGGEKWTRSKGTSIRRGSSSNFSLLVPLKCVRFFFICHISFCRGDIYFWIILLNDLVSSSLGFGLLVFLTRFDFRLLNLMYSLCNTEIEVENKLIQSLGKRS